ncbi:MAG: purine-nucleoside phosphorylase [Treponema sp.]|jgi:purine-nucleoside phosphorylase|nr:purine-nucleoside phosphorylase [Treponema sp.]
MSTPHNAAEKGQIAKTVLMPGDPLRAQFIAKTYLENPVEFNHVRGMLGFTGTYRGKSVSVMGSGMGMPSIGIYSYELFTRFDVDAIIRIGSAGGYRDTLKLFDVILVTEAYSESSYARCQNGFTGDRIRAGEELCEKLRVSAARTGVPLIEGAIHSSDVFYREEDGSAEPYWRQVMREQNCVGVEMESFALFHNANVTGKKAACLLTISDVLTSTQITTAEQREKSFTRMMEVALGIL